MVSPALVAVSVTVPMLIPVSKPVMELTVAEPLPAAIEYVINPPLPKVALVVVVAVKLPSTFRLLAEVMLSVGVVLPIVICWLVLAG